MFFEISPEIHILAVLKKKIEIIFGPEAAIEPDNERGFQLAKVADLV